MSMKYPNLIRREMLRINREWLPRRDKSGIKAQALPAFLETVAIDQDGKKSVGFIFLLDASPTELEQSLEYYRRAARRALRRYAEYPEAKRAQKAAECMMRANLVSQFFNQALGQDPLKDLPFPLKQKRRKKS